MTLTEFLLERLDSDERAVHNLAERDHRPVLSLATTVNHPQRLLTECEAKRRIVTLLEAYRSDAGSGDRWHAGRNDAADMVLRLLALPYADHADYRSAWRP